jgi:NAD+ kinase
MKVALFPNHAIAQSEACALTIKDFFQAHQIKASIFQDFNADIDKLKEMDYLITLGGDGTILKLKHHYPDIDIPILGVNVGHLGFMADIQTTDIYPSLQDFIEKKFTVQERLMLEGHQANHDFMFACNDIVIHRGSHPSIVQIAVHVDGSYFNTFEADGIIVSTPNGSTAYSLAAGGPILSPEIDAVVITPICPHTISNRPLVIAASHEIQLSYLTPDSKVEVRFDGSWMMPLETGDTCTIKKSKRKFKLVKLNRSEYFATLRSKLNWQGRLRY